MGFNHNLEIHEKPTANSILLAAATGFPISPDSRSYVFRVEDDGHSAVLSFVDAAAPAVRKTKSHPTASTVLPGGHIGFESCWGSPVLLDNVRIFRLRAPATQPGD